MQACMNAMCWHVQGARGTLSQDLVALWVDEFGPALALLRRVFPPGLVRYLSVRKPTPSPLQLPKAGQQSQVCATVGVALH